MKVVLVKNIKYFILGVLQIHARRLQSEIELNLNVQCEIGAYPVGTYYHAAHNVRYAWHDLIIALIKTIGGKD